MKIWSDHHYLCAVDTFVYDTPSTDTHICIVYGDTGHIMSDFSPENVEHSLIVSFFLTYLHPSANH